MIEMRSKRRLRSTRSQRGVTLVEMMVALGIMAFGILTMALMQLAALKQGSQGQHTTDAAAVGRTYVEQVHRLPWSELTTAVAAGDWTNPSWAGANPSVTLALDTPLTGTAAPGQTYAVAWRVTDVAGNTCLRDVEIRITWNEEDFAAPRTLTLSTRRYNWGGSSC
jgi:prepilin-type N-terminal cleavage/methylation domain-containing protein